MPDRRDFPMPDLGEGLTEGEIVRWLVAEGDTVHVDQPIAEISTEKAVVEVPTPFAGTVSTLHGQPGDLIRVGTPLITIDVEGDVPAADSEQSGNVLVGYGTNEEPVSRRVRTAPAPAAAPASPVAASLPPASPLVRRRAVELGIDLGSIAGTGPGGIVTQADLERAAEPQANGETAPAGAAATAEATRQRLTGIDRVAAERLTRSHRDIPTATASLTVEATDLLRWRDRFDARSGDVHVTPFVVLLRLCVLALREHPRLNAHFDTDANEIVLFEPVHLGVAVQTDRGLVVPVVRDAQTLTTIELAEEVGRLSAVARNGSISAEALRGSSFTVSNFGAFGVDDGSALINPPEVAILGVGRIAERPWMVGGGIAPRHTVTLSLVFDHRVADGAVGGGFVKHIGDLIEHAGDALSND